MFVGLGKPESTFAPFLWWRPNDDVFELMEGIVGSHADVVDTSFSRSTEYSYSYSGFHSEEEKKEEGFFKD